MTIRHTGRHHQHTLRYAPNGDRRAARRAIPVLLVLILNTIGWWYASVPPGWLLNGSAAFIVAAGVVALHNN